MDACRCRLLERRDTKPLCQLCKLGLKIPVERDAVDRSLCKCNPLWVARQEDGIDIGNSRRLSDEFRQLGCLAVNAVSPCELLG